MRNYRWAYLAHWIIIVGSIPLTFVLPSDVDLWPYTGGLGVLVSVAQLLFSFRLPDKAAMILGSISAILLGVGWGSWFDVGLRYEPNDPVINVAGILVLPGLFFGIFPLFINRSERSRSR